MSEEKKRRVISQTLENVRRGVEKTEVEPVEGVTADAIDGAEAMATLLKLYRSAEQKAASKPTPTLNKKPNISVRVPDHLISDLSDLKSPKYKRLAKSLKPLARRLPHVELSALGYETAALINSEEAREKAKEQANVMGERGYSAEGINKNALQSLLDPAGTIYAAGDALVDTVGTVGGLAYDKLFGPSEEEQREAAKFRRQRRREALRLARMAPEQKEEHKKMLKRRADELEQRKRNNPLSPEYSTLGVRHGFDKEADDLDLISLLKRPH